MNDKEKKALFVLLAKEALAVQDASNLSGVLLSYQRSLVKLKELLGGNAADSHPISQVWADKVAHLSRTQTLGNSEVMAAFDIVHNIAEGRVDP
jgi:hypothetical protein